MFSFHRQNAIALLVILVLGHMALMIHMTSHIPVDQTHCEFCAGHGGLDQASPPSAIALLVPLAYTIRSDFSHIVTGVSSPIFYRERAPPNPA